MLYLGKTGKCKIEDSPKGWILCALPTVHPPCTHRAPTLHPLRTAPACAASRLYKPVDQEEALRDQLSDKRKRAEETEEARQDRMIEEQRQRAKMLRREAGGEESEEEAAPTCAPSVQRCAVSVCLRRDAALCITLEGAHVIHP